MVAAAISPVAAGLWGRSAVTALVVVVAWGLGQLPALGVDAYLEDAGGELAGSVLSLTALGLFPLVLSFILVELVALAVPALRSRRLGSPARRRPLVRASIIVGLIIALVQALLTAHYLNMWAFDSYVPLVPFVASVVAGTMAVYGLCVLNDRFGIGSGFALLQTLVVAPEIVHYLVAAAQVASNDVAGVLPSLAGVVAVIVILVVLLRPPATLRRYLGSDGVDLAMPTSGVMSLALGPGLLVSLAILVATIFGHWFDVPPEMIVPVNSPLLAPYHVVLVVVLITLLAWLFNQPRRVAATVRALGTPVSVARARRALIRATSFTLAAVLGAMALSTLVSGVLLLPGLATLAAATAVILDLACEWRGRREHGPLVEAWQLQQVYAVEAVIQLLQTHGIVATTRGRFYRQLLHFLGPFVPLVILVPQHQHQQAHDLLAVRLDPDGRLIGQDEAEAFD